MDLERHIVERIHGMSYFFSDQLMAKKSHYNRVAFKAPKKNGASYMYVEFIWGRNPIWMKIFTLTLIGMRGDTFISLPFTDQIIWADFLSKLSKLLEGENWHQLGYFDTLPNSLSLIKEDKTKGYEKFFSNHQNFTPKSVLSIIL